MARYGDGKNQFDNGVQADICNDLSDVMSDDTLDEILDVATDTLSELSTRGDSRTERMARWLVHNLGVPDNESFPGVMVDNYDDTISLSEEHLEWWPVREARLLAASILRAVDRLKEN